MLLSPWKAMRRLLAPRGQPLGRGRPGRSGVSGCRDPKSCEGESPDDSGKEPLRGSLVQDLQRIREEFGNSADLVIRELRAGNKGRVLAAIVHIEGLIDRRLVSEAIVMRIADSDRTWDDSKQAFIDLKERFLASTSLEETGMLDRFISCISAGQCGVLLDGIPRGLICGVQGWSQRSPEEPTTETTIRGSKEGFVESLRTNTSLLRRRIMSPRLWIEERKIGTLGRTGVAIAYVEGVANAKTVQEVRNRLDRIDVDAIQESGQLEEYIEDAPFSPFPTVIRTERPDRVVGNLLEGRVALLTDGTPFVLVVPVTFMMCLSSPEDYFERSLMASPLRFIRVIAFMMSLILPSIYVSVTTFHQEMLPTPLILNIAAQREGVPFPAVIEALVMELTFEIMREAGVRLPRIVGPAISIVGTLVLGDAAIRAGLVSPAMVVVVAATGIASLATPSFSLAVGVRILRFLMILLAGTLGMFGVWAGLFALFTHLAALRSFGVPFFEPLAPLVLSDLKDALVVFPWWGMRTRPLFTGGSNPVRQGPRAKPEPPSGSDREISDAGGGERGRR
ncbi:MAG: spore germination protein [Clostridia bacterium]|nr:spore germination protein [Clostridia bacterium]